MRRAVRLVLPALFLLVLTAGCGGGDDPKPGPKPVPVPTTATGSVDVCDLVPARLRDQVDVYDDLTTKLSYGSEGFVACGQPGSVTFEYGYQVAGKERMPELGEQVTAVKGLGDRAVLDQNRYSATFWVEHDGVLVKVRDDAILNSGGKAITLDTARAVTEAMVKAVTPAVVKATKPVLLGGSCPPAGSAVVTDLVGTVVAARGGSQSGDAEPECQYLGAGDTRIDLGVLVQDDVEKDFFSADDDKVVAMSGVRKAWTPTYDGGPGQVSLDWTTADDVLWSLDASPLTYGADYQDRSGKATLAGGMALGRAFMKLNPGVGG